MTDEADRKLTPRSGKERREQPPRKQGATFKAFGAEVEITGAHTIIALLLVLGGANSALLWLQATHLERLAIGIEQSASATRMLGCMVGGDPAQHRRDRYDECTRILGGRS